MRSPTFTADASAAGVTTADLTIVTVGCETRSRLVAEQLRAQFGSDVPAAGAAVTVLANVPVVAAGTVPETVYVKVPPAATMTVSAMLPGAGPLAVHVLPADATQLQMNPAPVSPAGRVSVTVAPTASDGPGLATD